jgi:hypothetical protein
MPSSDSNNFAAVRVEQRVAVFDAVERLQQLPRLVELRTNQLTVSRQTQLAQSMTALMQPNAMRIFPRYSIDLEHVGKELTKLVSPRPYSVEFDGVAQNLLVMMTDHRNAASRRANHVIVGSENPQEPLDQRLGFGVEAGIGHRLAAASLLYRKLDLDAEVFEHVNGRQPNLGIKLVDVTRNEQPNSHIAIVR